MLDKHVQMYTLNPMDTTLGIHWAITTYGTWLHGNSHGSWREGRLIDADPFLEASAQAAMNHQAVVLDEHERSLVAEAIGNTVRENRYRVLAATIQGSHLHLVFAPLPTDVKRVVAQLKYRSAVAVLADRRHCQRPTPRSLWTRGQFPVFIFGEKHLANAVEYVRDHNRRVGLSPDPFEWIEPLYRPSDLPGERFQKGVPLW